MARNWEGIDAFVAVATAGSFAAAARHLDISTSHVSRAVARLEASLQTQLFYRTTRKVSLTDTGRMLVERCRDVIRRRDQLLDMVADGGEPQGELRVTCSTTLGARYVAPIIARMSQHYPRLSVSLELNNRVVDLVAEGFDLAIRTGTLSDSRLMATRIASRRLYLCASPDYLARAGHPRDMADLASHACLIGNAATWHFHVDGKGRTFRPKGKWRSNNGEAVLVAAQAGLGICQLPEFYVLPLLASGALEELLAEARPPDEPVWAVYPQQRHQLPKVRALVERLRVELVPALGLAG